MQPQVFAGGHDTTIVTLVLYWAVVYFWAGSEFFLGWRQRANARAANQSDAGSVWVVIAAVWTSVAIGIWLSILFPRFAFTSHRQTMFAIGLLLMLAGLALRWYSIIVLGRSFTTTVATRPDQTVVESGPYRWIRHPSYAGSLLTILGSQICLTNPAAFLSLLIAIAGYAYRIRVEERVLARHLGETYRDYMRRTKRLIPFLI